MYSYGSSTQVIKIVLRAAVRRASSTGFEQQHTKKHYCAIIVRQDNMAKGRVKVERTMLWSRLQSVDCRWKASAL